MKWINAKENPPKKDGKYLVCTTNLTGYNPLEDDVLIATFMGGEWIFNGWKYNNVTHWMNKPKKPKK